MKTVSILAILLSPYFLSGQSIAAPPTLPILAKGEAYLNRNRADSALILTQNILSQSGLSLLDRSQALLISGKALYDSIGSEASIPILEQSLLLARKLRNNPIKLRALVYLSTCYGDQENPELDAVISCLEEAKPLAILLKDTSNLAKIYNNYANIYTEEGNCDLALANYYLCEALLKNSKYEYELGLCHYGIGRNLVELYIKNGEDQNLKTAIDYCKKAIGIFERLGKKKKEALARSVVGIAASYTNDFEQAEQQTKFSIGIGEQLKDSSLLLDGYYVLANLYESENKLEAAKSALNQMIDLLGTAKNRNDVSFITDQFSNNEIRVSVALVKNRVGLLDKQIEILKSKQENQRMWFVSILSLLLGLVAFMYAVHKRKSSAHKQQMLQEKLENMLKSHQIEFMRAKFEGEEESRHRIARQIHDGVGGLLVSAKWNLESALEEISKSETKVAARLNENLRLQEHSYKELRRVVYALEREDIPWWEDLQQFYQHIEGQNKAKIRFYTYNLDRKVGGAVGEEARLIVQELIANALKHASASQINVQINQIEDVLGIIIEDNGIGFDLQKAKKGIGLRSIEERCRKLDGTISFETGKGVGTTVFIDIPVNKYDSLTDNPLLYARTN